MAHAFATPVSATETRDRAEGESVGAERGGRTHPLFYRVDAGARTERAGIGAGAPRSDAAAAKNGWDVGGYIPRQNFRWRTDSVPDLGRTPSGWRACCFQMYFRPLVPSARQILCPVYIGMPIRTHRGETSEEQATAQAQLATYVAARATVATLGTAGPFAGDVCALFFRHLNGAFAEFAAAGDATPGSMARRCVNAGDPPTS